MASKFGSGCRTLDISSTTIKWHQQKSETITHAFTMKCLVNSAGNNFSLFTGHMSFQIFFLVGHLTNCTGHNLLTDKTLKKITQDVLVRCSVIVSNHNVKLARHFQNLVGQCPMTDCYFQHWVKYYSWHFWIQKTQLQIHVKLNCLDLGSLLTFPVFSYIVRFACLHFTAVSISKQQYLSWPCQCWFGNNRGGVEC